MRYENSQNINNINRITNTGKIHHSELIQIRRPYPRVLDSLIIIPIE